MTGSDPQEETAANPQAVALLREQLASAEAERVAAEDRFLRARADLDNYRKRSASQIARQVAEGHDKLLQDWLEVVDSIRQASRAGREHADPQLGEGLRALDEQVTGILTRQGVQSLGRVGQHFDPAVHEVVATQPAEGVEDGTVIEVARYGYGVGDRLLRPARVVVARAVS